MKRRRYHLPPPKNATYRSGMVIELSAADDLINAGKPLPPLVELTPAGPPLLMVELRAEDDRVNTGKPIAEQLAMLESLANGPKTFSAIGRYLYLVAESELLARELGKVLARLEQERLLARDPTHGWYQLTARGRITVRSHGIGERTASS